MFANKTETQRGGQPPSERNNMRAIFINAVDQKIEEIEIENTLDAFYARIGCNMIQCINLGANHI